MQVESSIPTILSAELGCQIDLKFAPLVKDYHDIPANTLERETTYSVARFLVMNFPEIFPVPDAGQDNDLFIIRSMDRFNLIQRLWEALLYDLKHLLDSFQRGRGGTPPARAYAIQLLQIVYAIWFHNIKGFFNNFINTSAASLLRRGVASRMEQHPNMRLYQEEMKQLEKTISYWLERLG